MESGWRRNGRGAGSSPFGGVRFLLAATTLASTVAVLGTSASSARAGMEWPSSIVPHPETVSADVMPTVQIDGVVWAQEIVGNVVYVGGEFSNARPAGAAINTNETPRANFLAYDLNTGALITGIRFDTNGPVKSLELSPDGSRLYVGGQFTRLGAQVRNRLAAINLADNTIVANFNPALNATVNAIDATADRVYVGGLFTAVGSTSRDRLAAFDVNGGLIAAWDPRVDRSITSLVVSPDNAKVAIGGSFEVLNGSTTYRGLAFVNASNGDTLSMGAGNRIRSSRHF